MNKNKTGKVHSRSLNSCNTARVIIVDISSKSLDTFCETIISSLEEFLSLHGCLPGLPRIQLFSVYALGNGYKCITPLQHTRINFQKIMQSLKDLINLSKQINGDSREYFDDDLSSIIIDSVNQLQHIHKASSASTAKNLNIASQLDICFLTNQQHCNIEKHFARIIKENEMELIKKVQVVRVNCSDLRDVQSSQDSSGSTDSGITEVICGYIESLYLENNKLSFDQFFRKWLHDSGTDDIHMCVEFQGFSLKCDLLDTMINPINIPGAHNFLLETEVNFQIAHPPSVKGRQKSVNIYTLTPQTLIPIDGICESVLYGIPYIVKPTTCWKLEWEELEKNQSYFQSVNTYLLEKNLGLLLMTQEVHSYYLLLPSSGSTMLIKSIAVRDIMMPTDTCTNNAIVKNDVINKEVLDQMEKINLTQEYNPFHHTCNLFIQKSTNVQQTTTKPTSSVQGIFHQNLSSSSSKYTAKPLTSRNDGGSTQCYSEAPKHSSAAATTTTTNKKKVSPWHVYSDENTNPLSTLSLKKKKPRFEPPKAFSKKF